MTPREKGFFLENGYLCVEGALEGTHSRQIQEAFDQAWDAEGGDKTRRVATHQLLKYRPFIDLVAHQPILDRQRAIFGRQTQLLSYDLLRQGPHSTFPERAWHRDFTFPGDYPLAINTIIFVDQSHADVATARQCAIPACRCSVAAAIRAVRGTMRHRAMVDRAAAYTPASNEGDGI